MNKDSLVVAIEEMYRNHPIPAFPNFKLVSWNDKDTLASADVYLQHNIIGQKRKKLEKYYDEWGSRFYIFSSELGKNWLNTKYNNPSIAIELNTWHLYDLGGRYIFSANEILNGSDNKLRLIRTFEEKKSPWKIYLYEVSNNNLKS